MRDHRENKRTGRGIELELLGRTRLCDTLCAEGIAFDLPPLDDVPLDLVCGFAIENLVSKSHSVRIAGSTHIVNFSIASRAN